MNEPGMPKVTVTFKREEMDDDSPDLSWLDQSDKEMGEGFEAQSRERLAAYKRGDWHMIGIRAVATIWIKREGYMTNYTIESPGLWGIESDSDAAYLQSVYEEECAVLREDIEAFTTAEFKS